MDVMDLRGRHALRWMEGTHCDERGALGLMGCSSMKQLVSYGNRLQPQTSLDPLSVVIRAFAFHDQYAFR